MKLKDWIELAIGGAIGTAGVFLAKYFYKKIKKGKLDRLLTPEEKKNLIEAIEKFLTDMKEGINETPVQSDKKP